MKKPNIYLNLRLFFGILVGSSIVLFLVLACMRELQASDAVIPAVFHWGDYELIHTPDNKSILVHQYASEDELADMIDGPKPNCTFVHTQECEPVDYGSCEDDED